MEGYCSKRRITLFVLHFHMSTDQEVLTEEKILLNSLESVRDKISDTMNQLDAKLKELSDTNCMIQSTPKKFAEKLESSIPKIVQELKAVVAEELNTVKFSYTEDMIAHDKFLKEHQEKMQELSSDMIKIEKRRIIRFFLGIVISSAISVGCATYAASYMMQTFPTRVTIDKPENIILYDSEVGLWGTDNVKVLKGLKKNDRKNKHKL